MNKRLKILLFTLLGVVVVAGLAVGGFFLLRASSMADVYNLQIVSAEGNPVNDTSRFLLTNVDNKFAVNVNMETSSGHSSFYFTTSDSSVANVVYDKNEQKYFVEYYKAGAATITARTGYSSMVYDSFVLNVYNNFIADIVLGKSANNLLQVYADNTEDTYDYVATGVLNSEDCNNMLIRVVDDYDKTVFDKISINPIDKTIKIKTKQVTEDSTQVFYLQTYYIDNAGEEHVVKNHPFFVDVVGYRIVDIQLLVSASEKFEGNANVWLSDGTHEDPYQGYGEKIITNLVLSDSVKDLYFKARIIYSNNSTDDVSNRLSYVKPQQESVISISDSSVTKMNCLRLQFNAPEKTEQDRVNADNLSESFTVKFERSDINSTIEKNFKITYKYEGSAKFDEFKNKDLYVKLVDGDKFLRYEYIYWDTRYRRTDTETDLNGYIVGFKNGDPACNVIDTNENNVIG